MIKAIYLLAAVVCAAGTVEAGYYGGKEGNGPTPTNGPTNGNGPPEPPQPPHPPSLGPVPSGPPDYRCKPWQIHWRCKWPPPIEVFIELKPIVPEDPPKEKEVIRRVQKKFPEAEKPEDVPVLLKGKGK